MENNNIPQQLQKCCNIGIRDKKTLIYDQQKLIKSPSQKNKKASGRHVEHSKHKIHKNNHEICIFFFYLPKTKDFYKRVDNK